MSYRDSHELLVRLLKRDRLFTRQRLIFQVTESLLLRESGDGWKAIDPVDCGCTDCQTGLTRPARDEAEYELAKACEVSR